MNERKVAEKRINKLNFFSEKLHADQNDHLEINAPKGSAPNITVVDLPSESATKNIVSKTVLDQLEQRIKNLIAEQQTIHSKFDALLENVRNAVIIINQNRQIIKINNNFTRLTEYEKSELENKTNIITLFIKKDRKRVEQLLKEVDHRQATSDGITIAQCLCKDKSTRFVELNIATIPNQNQIMVFLNNITDRKQYEQEILKRNEELTILNSISRSIKQPKNLHQILSLVLGKTGQLMGMEMGAIYLGNRHLKSLQPIVVIGLSQENAKKLLDQNLTVIKQLKKEKEDVFLNPSNGILWEIFNKQPKCRSMALLPFNNRKNTFGILALVSKKAIEFDQEKKQLLSAIGHQLAIYIENALLFQELEEKTKEVEAKNKELGSFVFTVSHDLKTPLIALHGFLELFKEEFQDLVDETGKEYLDRILHNAEYMDKMINDLLKLSRAGRVVGTKRRFSTYKLVKEVYMCFYPQFQHKEIKFFISKNLPIIYGDRQRLQTVFENLIGNAIKYSSDKREPYITIECKDQTNFFEFVVKDNGVGIDPEDHHRIFEVFQKCGKRNDSAGTGVGLTIVKKIIEHHGGSVWVDSKLDEGASFYFTLPKPSTQ